MKTNLCKFVADSGYNATQVADMAGIPQANLGRYMRGESAIPSDALASLKDALGRASIEDFLNPSPPPQATKEELALAQPMFGKTRPGALEPTEEDMADYREFLQKVRSRREKKKAKR